MNNIWYLEHPIYRYEQGVKGLAQELGLVIVDPENAPADRPGAAPVVPTVTLRPEFRAADTMPAHPAPDRGPEQVLAEAAQAEPVRAEAPAPAGRPKTPKKAASTNSIAKE